MMSKVYDIADIKTFISTDMNINTFVPLNS